MKKTLLMLCLLLSVTAFTQSWKANSNVYEVNVRQYTPEGTFAAFEKHLPRIKRMGIDIIWLMPVQPIGEQNRKGSLGSYYSVKDYTAVNLEFGSNDDFRHLVQVAHSLGMKVVIDWVANHSAWDNPWAKEHPEYYQKDSVGGFVIPWDWTDVIALDYSNAGTRKAMTDAMNYWVKEFGIDGFRCDVAFLVPTDFWKEARNAIDPDKKQYWLAEAEVPELMEVFDACYAWNQLHVMNSIAKGEKMPNEIINLMLKKDSMFGKEVMQMAFVTNHDENSWNGTEFERYGDRVQLYTVLAFTLYGQPLVYSGQEGGLNKALRFFDKDTIYWNTLPYEEMISQLLYLRHTERALWSGFAANAPQFEKHVNPEVVVYRRTAGDSEIIVVLNFSNKAEGFKVREGEILEDVLGNVLIHAGETISIPAGQAKVYKVMKK